MKLHILSLVGILLDNAAAIVGGIYVGHRFAGKVDGIYNFVEGLIAKVVGLIRGAKKVAPVAK
jgi:hypothetical protein